ncbi:MAG: hypothetical protein AAF236_15255 [Verrucomicrobiota bacterium]
MTIALRLGVNHANENPPPIPPPLAAFALSCCSPTGHGAANGALIGTGIGAIAAGDGARGRGAVIGAGVGAAGGAALGARNERRWGNPHFGHSHGAHSHGSGSHRHY